MAAVAALAPARKRRRVIEAEEGEPVTVEGVLVCMCVRLNEARLGFNPKSEVGMG